MVKEIHSIKQLLYLEEEKLSVQRPTQLKKAAQIPAAWTTPSPDSFFTPGPLWEPETRHSTRTAAWEQRERHPQNPTDIQNQQVWFQNCHGHHVRPQQSRSPSFQGLRVLHRDLKCMMTIKRTTKTQGMLWPEVPQSEGFTRKRAFGDTWELNRWSPGVPQFFGVWRNGAVHIFQMLKCTVSLIFLAC